MLRFALLAAAAGLAAVAVQPAQAAKPRVGVLSELAPMTDRRDADEAVAALNKLGYAVSVLTPEQLADRSHLAPSRYDVVVIPRSDTFPAAAQPSLMAYLAARGKVLFLGGPPFTRYVFKTDAGWKTREAIMGDIPVARTFFDLNREDLTTWKRASNDPSTKAAITVEGSPNGPAIHLSWANYTEWDNYAPPAFGTSPYPAGADLLVFWAKGDARTDALVVEWKEQDGSRWIGSVPLTTEWRRYVMTPRDFRYWQDNTAQGRGGPNDQFHPERAHILSMGLAQSHAAMSPGAKNIWIAGIGAAKSPGAMPSAEPPVLEAVSPWYKRTAQGGEWGPIERYRGAVSVQPPGRLRMFGETAWDYRPYAGTYNGAAWGVSRRSQIVPEQLADLVSGWHVSYAGPASVYQADATAPVAFNAQLVNGDGAAVTVRAELELTPTTSGKTPAAPVRAAGQAQVGPGGQATLTVRRAVPAPGDYGWTLTFRGPSGQVADSLHGLMTVGAPATRRTIVQVRGSEFVADGRPWRPIGVNFWPLWVSGQEPNEYFAGWLSPDQYDPLLVERDLTLAEKLHVNEASIQYHRLDQAPCLADFVTRCQAHGIRVNVYVAGGHPLEQDLKTLAALVKAANVADNPGIFNWDVAWEPHAGTHNDRKRLDREWENWILTNYGSVANAESDWGVPAPREGGAVTNPADNQITQDGSWRKMVAAYRRFLDDRISWGYRATVRTVRAIDPNHLIAARSGYGGNGSLWAEGPMAFDLLAGAYHLDFVSPEGYALNGDARSYRNGGGYTTAYARWASNGKPVFWAEYGRSVYPNPTPQKLQIQADTIENTLRMVQDEGANGAASWWWPGGLRVDENSDFGIIAPDGTPRPAALAQSDYGARIEPTPSSAGRKPTDEAIVIDRDKDARGYAGLWLTGRDEYGRLRDTGVNVVIKTPGTGTTTADMPLVAVGGTPANGHNPLKYANAEFAQIATEKAGNGVRLRVTAANTGEAAWVTNGSGAVVLLVQAPGQAAVQVPLNRPTARFATGIFVSRPLPVPANATVTLRLAVTGRDAGGGLLPFGESTTVTVKTVQ